MRKIELLTSSILYLVSKQSEPAVGIGKLIGFGVGFPMGVHGDGSNFLLRQRTVIPVGLNAGNGIHQILIGDLREVKIQTIMYFY